MIRQYIFSISNECKHMNAIQTMYDGDASAPVFFFFFSFLQMGAG